jgi:hypothetical protein
MREKELNNLEKLIPTLASGALHKAYLDTLSNGNSVLEVIDSVIYEVFPDGKKVKVKEISPVIKVDITKKLSLK